MYRINKYYLLFFLIKASILAWAVPDSLHKVNYEHNSVLLKNQNNLIPLRSLDTLNIATLNLSNHSNNKLENTLDLYTASVHYHFNTFSSKRIMKAMKKEMEEYNLVIIISDTMHIGMANFIESISDNKKLILNYSNQKNLPNFSIFSEIIDGIIYNPNSKNSHIDCQIMMGGYPTSNTLNHDLNEVFKSGHGISTNKTRISYGKPSDLAIEDIDLQKIDSIVYNAIDEGAMPGCQVLAAKDGHVFFQKSFGTHTYDSNALKVKKSDIYDLASITKIASSALILMQLQSIDSFNIDTTLGYYLPSLLDSSEYKNLYLKDILTHQAGLASWIPFYLKTLNEGQPSDQLYSNVPTLIHQKRVAENLYILNSYRDTIFQKILSTKLKKKKKYKYSDLGYYFINEIIKEITGKEQDIYLDELYDKIGIENIGYNPRNKWDINRIPPTENDTTFRHQLVHADVHDQGAALLGGVCGHAGLFSNANDLAVIMQLYLNKGVYGGDTIIKEDIIDQYTSSPYYISNNNRRGIAFDKPVRKGAGGPTCFECASVKSFGHSGFTGNLTWADPESGILYVFLSNRVYPYAYNPKLIRMNVRTDIMNVITEACNYSTVSKAATP